MKVLKGTAIKKEHGEKSLFTSLDFAISENDKIGLIGLNGTGKSSLLAIIAGKDEADQGEIEKPKDYTVSFLEQKLDVDDDEKVISFVFRNDAPVFQLVKQYEEIVDMVKQNPTDKHYLEKMYKLQTAMDAQNGWELHSSAQTMLSRLGIDDISVKMGSLSGGQKKRCALAKVLMEQPDLLILDEPTNHLDYDSIQWLQDFVTSYQGSVLFVTHDRYFLDGCSQKIWELENGKLYSYTGNYQTYLEIKATRLENEVRATHKLDRLFKSELSWIRKGAKARSTKQKARIDRFEQIQEEHKLQTNKTEMDMGLGATRLGKKVLELKNVSKRFGEHTLLNSFSALLQKGDRIGVIGSNGTGKTTLLDLLAGELLPDTGEVIQGQTVNIGYYKQESEDLPTNKRMIEYLRESAEIISLSDGEKVSAAQMLERFLFPPHSHGTMINKLSGGEKRRLYLLKILMDAPNVLLLDEPTNDLDIQTLTILEQYLEQFPGVVITVSHDRYFLDKTSTKLWVLAKEETPKIYFGLCSDFLEWQKEQTPLKLKNSMAKEQETPVPVQRKKLTYQEQCEWEVIEEKVSNVEAELADVSAQLSKTGSNFELVHTLSEMETKLNNELEYLIDRWSYLSEKMDNTSS